MTSERESSLNVFHHMKKSIKCFALGIILALTYSLATITYTREKKILQEHSIYLGNIT